MTTKKATTKSAVSEIVNDESRRAEWSADVDNHGDTRSFAQWLLANPTPATKSATPEQITCPTCKKLVYVFADANGMMFVGTHQDPRQPIENCPASNTSAISAVFTNEEIVAIKQAARRTWDAIAHDLFLCSETDVMKRDEVIECVLDADHMRFNGGLTRELMKRVYATPESVLMPLMKSVFLYERYGK